MWTVLRLQRLCVRLCLFEPPTGRRGVTVGRAGPEPARPRVELLWFRDWPNQRAARALPADLPSELAPGTAVEDTDATDVAVARRHTAPGAARVRARSAGLNRERPRRAPSA